MSSRPLARWLAAVLGLLLLAAALAGALYARFDDDPLAALPADDPEVRAFREAAAPFGTLDTLLIGVERDDLFSRDSLDRLRTFVRRASVVPGVVEVVCFTEVPLITASSARTEVADLVPRPVPDDPAKLDEVRRNVLHNDLVVGRLVAADGRAALLPITLDPHKRPLRETAREVSDLAQHVLEGGRVVVDGAPGAALALAVAQTSAAPLVGIVVTLALLLAPALLFRRARPVVLALLAAVASTLVALLPTGLLGLPLGPAALVALLGVAGAALLVSAYVLLAPNPASARSRALGPAAHAALASVATAAVALTLAGQDAIALILLTGMAAAFVAAAFVLPALVRPQDEDERAVAVPEARPLLALVLTLACAVLYLGVPRLQVAVEPAEAFPPGNSARVAEEFLLDHFGGSATLIAALEGNIATPEALDALRALESVALADPAVREAPSLLGAVRTAGKADGRQAELPATAAAVRRFFLMAAGQPGLGQLVRSTQDAAAVLVKIAPLASPADAVRVRDALLDAVPSALRYGTFAEAPVGVRERMEAELLDRLSQRLAPLGIAPQRRTPALLGDLLDRIGAAAGPDVAALRARLAEHFIDGTTYVLVRDLESNEPLAVGEAEQGKLAERIAAAGAIDDAAVRAALLEVFPAAAADAEGLEAEARMLRQALDRVAASGAGKTVLPPFVEEWAVTETVQPGDAARAEGELLAASSELRQGGIALPDGTGVRLRLRVGGMPLAAASTRGETIRNLTTAFLSAAILLLVLWTMLLLVGEGGPLGGGASGGMGFSGLVTCVGRAVQPTVVPLVAASLAFGGAGYLGLPVEPGATVTFAVTVLLGGTLAGLLLLPGAPEWQARPWSDARRVALHLGPALAAVGLGLSLIPLPPARTLGLLLAASTLGALVLGWAHSGRR
jgi:hypothetical protein